MPAAAGILRLDAYQEMEEMSTRGTQNGDNIVDTRILLYRGPDSSASRA